MSRILIAEDEARIASFLEKGLRANGFTTVVAADGPEALQLAGTGEFDLLILDLGLPGIDGLDVLAALRRRGQSLPVVILTARDSVRDTVAGLEGGADDYIAKPFRFEELLARVRVRLRGERAPEETVLTAGDASLDLRTRLATVRGTTVELTAREFALAEMFFRHPGQVLSREQLLSHVWGYDYDPGSNVVDVYVGYLRKKLGKERVSGVRGMGYRLEKRAAPDSGRVLVIADEPGSSELIERGLRNDGNDVVTVREGELDLFVATIEDFDLVVLDVGTERASARAALEAITSERPELPVVVLTGDAQQADGAGWLAAGATDLVPKPFVPEELCALVRDRLAESRGS
jgi:two-component system, OmpR family, copper resistance phosphate regulon response regulator CusR